MAKGKHKITVKAKRPARGNGKLGYGEGGKLYSTNRRLDAILVNDQTDIKGRLKRDKKKRKENKKLSEIEQLSEFTVTRLMADDTTVKPGDIVTYNINSVSTTRTIKSIFNYIPKDTPFYGENPRVLFKDSGRLELGSGYYAGNHLSLKELMLRHQFKVVGNEAKK